ncbi:hypothetical protein M0M42_17605 [Pseudomonas knackmussii]|uniref:Uncharacterized protein n=1 Tax=Pseudomonas knackmussii TaxID=65741 RepID=A0ABY4KMX9_9PSED|nr:hypothetical protein [Pseudomonas knackmussii]UPQ82194.1 hypothetical protein M0M42_17605 [Pseudomonas knackmussii]
MERHSRRIRTDTPSQDLLAFRDPNAQHKGHDQEERSEPLHVPRGIGMSGVTAKDTSAATQTAEIDRNGFTVIENYISPDELEQGRAFIEQQAARHEGEYFAIHGIEALSGSIASALALSAPLKELLADLYRLQSGREAAATEQVFPAVRCLQGRTGLRQSHFYHFDATAVTALLPLYIPTEGEHCGDLIIFPNVRRVRFNALRNVIEKAVLHNTASQKLVAFAVRRGWLKPIRLKLVPGNLYLFSGYRSLHANDECAPDLLRATMLFHFGNPHHESTVARLLLGTNKRRAKLDHNGLRPVN